MNVRDISLYILYLSWKSSDRWSLRPVKWVQWDLQDQRSIQAVKRYKQRGIILPGTLSILRFGSDRGKELQRCRHNIRFVKKKNQTKEPNLDLACMVSLTVRANPCAKLHSLSPLSFPNIFCSHILVNATHTQKCVYQAILNNKKYCLHKRNII